MAPMAEGMRVRAGALGLRARGEAHVPRGLARLGCPTRRRRRCRPPFPLLGSARRLCNTAWPRRGAASAASAGRRGGGRMQPRGACAEERRRGPYAARNTPGGLQSLYTERGSPRSQIRCPADVHEAGNIRLPCECTCCAAQAQQARQLARSAHRARRLPSAGPLRGQCRALSGEQERRSASRWSRPKS
jgi:hypothetical protein